LGLAAFAQSSLRQIAAEGVPIIDLLPDSPEGISMVTRSEDAGFRATKHLIELGHGTLGLIGDVETRPKTTLRKLGGYKRALENAGMPFVEDVFKMSRSLVDGGRRGFQHLIERCPKITGLFCINDELPSEQWTPPGPG